jgi:hypothetical protein
METTEKDPVQAGTSTPSSHQDIEKTGDYAHLSNTSVHNFSWENVTITVKDRETGQPKAILKNSCGVVRAGNTSSTYQTHHMLTTL